MPSNLHPRSGARPYGPAVTNSPKEGEELSAKRRFGKPTTRLALAVSLALASAAVVVGVASSAGGQSPEKYNAKRALLLKAFGTTTGISKPVLAAVTRAGVPFTGKKLALALKCWKENVCDTGTGGKITVALADGFGENVWREVTHMEFVLEALTYPQIGKIIYTSGQGNTQKAISDFRSLIAQNVDVIVGFPDAGAAMLPSYRAADAEGIVVVPYTSTPGGTPGKDYDGVRLRGSVPARQELRRRHEQAGQERQDRLPRRHAGQRPVQGLAGLREAGAEQDASRSSAPPTRTGRARARSRRCPASSASTRTSRASATSTPTASSAASRPTRPRRSRSTSS